MARSGWKDYRGASRVDREIGAAINLCVDAIELAPEHPAYKLKPCIRRLCLIAQLRQFGREELLARLTSTLEGSVSVRALSRRSRAEFIDRVQAYANREYDRAALALPPELAAHREFGWQTLAEELGVTRRETTSIRLRGLRPARG